MPTKKRRVGFIPRSDVLDLINKLSFESNLSISKIINILVEEALYERGIFNIKNGKVLISNVSERIKNLDWKVLGFYFMIIALVGLVIFASSTN